VAVRYGNLARVKLLLTFNPYVGKHPNDDTSPLHSAVHDNHVEIARLLLAHNADRLARDFMGSIPLHHVYSPEMVHLLLEHLPVQQMGSVDCWGCPPWKEVLRAADCSPSIMPTFDALIRAMPEHMVNQLQSSVQDFEVVLAEMEGADFVSWAGIACSSSEGLHHVLDVMRQKITSRT
jgi:ankyrin repeat protein